MKKGDIVAYPRKFIPKGGNDDEDDVVYGVIFSEIEHGIEFFENVRGHQGGKDYLKDGHCWFCIENYIKVIEGVYDQ